MKQQKIEFHNLRNLLPTQESRVRLSEATDIPLTTINAWLDQENKSMPKAKSLVKIANYFNCSIDYLLDLTDRRYMI